MDSPQPELDLVGGTFAVIESDPGVFTTLIRKLGIKNVDVEEVYDIHSWALDHLKAKGLILCYLWKSSRSHSGVSDPLYRQEDEEPEVWFTNQLCENACATQAILNVLLNCPDVDVGEDLAAFKAETAGFDPVMKGLAVSNLPLLRTAHNQLARPADLRAALNQVIEATQLAQQAEEEAEQEQKSPAKKKQKAGSSSKRKASTASKKRAKTKTKKETEEEEESYHYVGYVPAHGKVWELDGLRSRPLEVGVLPSGSLNSTAGWEDVVRPALRLKMEKFDKGDGHIRFNLLALVEGRYEKKSDELELLKRERMALERRLDGVHPGGWQDKVDPNLVSGVQETFSTSLQDHNPGPTFAKDFGFRKMQSDLNVMNMDPDVLSFAWESCVTNAIHARSAVEEEIAKAKRAKTDEISRTHDYEPFIKEFLRSLHEEGMLLELIPSEY